MGKVKKGGGKKGGKGKSPRSSKSPDAGAAEGVVAEKSNKINIDEFLAKFGIAPILEQGFDGEELSDRARKCQGKLETFFRKKFSANKAIIEQINPIALQEVLSEQLQIALDTNTDKGDYEFIKFLFELSLYFYSQVKDDPRQRGTKAKILGLLGDNVRLFLNSPMFAVTSEVMQSRVLGAGVGRTEKIKLSDLSGLEMIANLRPKITFDDVSICLDIYETLAKSPIESGFLKEKFYKDIQLVLFRAIIEDDREALNRTIAIFCKKQGNRGEIDAEKLSDFITGLYDDRSSSNLALAVNSCISGDVLKLILEISKELAIDPDAVGISKVTPLHMAIYSFTRTYLTAVGNRISCTHELDETADAVKIDWLEIKSLLDYGCKIEKIDKAIEKFAIKDVDISRAVSLREYKDEKTAAEAFFQSVAQMNLSDNGLEKIIIMTNASNAEVERPRFNADYVITQALKFYKPDSFAFVMGIIRKHKISPGYDLSNPKGAREVLNENIFQLLNLMSRMCDDSSKIDAIIAEKFPRRAISPEGLEQLDYAMSKGFALDLGMGLCIRISELYNATKISEEEKKERGGILKSAIGALNGRACLMIHALTEKNIVGIDEKNKEDYGLLCVSLYRAILQYKYLDSSDTFNRIFFQQLITILKKFANKKQFGDFALIALHACTQIKEEISESDEAKPGNKYFALSEYLYQRISNGESLPGYRDDEKGLTLDLLDSYVLAHSYKDVAEIIYDDVLSKKYQEGFRSNKIILRAIDESLKAFCESRDCVDKEEKSRLSRLYLQSTRTLAILINHWSPCDDAKAQSLLTEILESCIKGGQNNFDVKAHYLTEMGLIKPVQLIKFVSDNIATLSQDEKLVNAICQHCLMIDPNCGDGFDFASAARATIVENKIDLLLNYSEFSVEECNSTHLNQYLQTLVEIGDEDPRSEGYIEACKKIADLAQLLNPYFESSRINLVIYSLIVNIRKIAEKTPGEIDADAEHRKLIANILQINPMVANSVIFTLRETEISPFERFIDDGKGGMISVFEKIVSDEIDFKDKDERMKLLKYFLSLDEVKGVINDKLAEKIIDLATSYYDENYLEILNRLFEIGYELPQINLNEGEFCPVLKIFVSGSTEAATLLKEKYPGQITKRIIHDGSVSKSGLIPSAKLLEMFNEEKVVEKTEAANVAVSTAIDLEHEEDRERKRQAGLVLNDMITRLEKLEEIEGVVKVNLDHLFKRVDAENEMERMLQGVVADAVQRVEDRREEEAAFAHPAVAAEIARLRTIEEESAWLKANLAAKDNTIAQLRAVKTPKKPQTKEIEIQTSPAKLTTERSSISEPATASHVEPVATADFGVQVDLDSGFTVEVNPLTVTLDPAVEKMMRESRDEAEKAKEETTKARGAARGALEAQTRAELESEALRREVEKLRGQLAVKDLQMSRMVPVMYPMQQQYYAIAMPAAAPAPTGGGERLDGSEKEKGRDD